MQKCKVTPKTKLRKNYYDLLISIFYPYARILRIGRSVLDCG